MLGLVFRRPFVKQFALCYGTVVQSVCLSCPVCDVGVLWPNGWTDQDETWHAGSPWPRPRCLKWGPSSPEGHSPPIFGPCHCGQTIGWIKMPLGRKIGLGPGHTVLDGDAVRPFLPKGSQSHDFQPMSLVAKRWPISATAELLFYFKPTDWLGNVSEMTYFVLSRM